MRGQVILADVRLDLDDPTGDPALRAIGDETAAQQRPGGVEGRPGEPLPRQDDPGQELYRAWTSDGRITPKIATKPGRRVSRKTAAVPESFIDP